MRNQRVYRNLMQLHPGEDAGQLTRSYYKGKLRTCLLIFLVGIILGVAGGEDGLLLFLLVAGTGVAVFFLLDKDLEQKNEERKMEMRKEYPGLVNRMSLYMEAGMTIRGAFLRIGSEFAVGKRAENPLAMELAIACNNLQSGVSEAVVYESFGRRTGTQEYTRFCSILSQSLRKGSVEICARLRQEGDRAMEDGLRLQKKRGEEAETKLLFPMMIMMAIVMLLIMIPAFSGMEI
ncbi:MAG: type II secretion system F family protein [Lachnospiraceae bacterium]|nr:type II secretion system F family protein [Lachnospiraceae bacterium]